MGASAAVAALANLALLVAPSVGFLLLARLVTGIALAGIYPPALKLISTWFQRGRGTALGAVIAALTLGSALPHLLRALTDQVPWQAVVVTASASTLLGGVLMALFGREGSFPFSRAPFDPRQIGAVLRNQAARASEPRLLRPHVGTLRHVGLVPDLRDDGPAAPRSIRAESGLARHLRGGGLGDRRVAGGRPAG